MKIGFDSLNARAMSDELKGFPILKFFGFQHLPEHLQAISKPFHALAMDAATRPTQHPAELAAGLRKLLEAKDCFVRAALP